MLAEDFQTFLLDLDGVVYVGDEPLPDAARSIERLRTLGKQLRFLTNDPRPTREEVVSRLLSFGIDAQAPEVVTCGWATAVHLQERRFASAYVVGSEGLVSEIEEAGIKVTRAEGTEAVVIGCDERVCYSDIRTAARLIRQGAQFIATNEDPTFPTPQGPAPATGTIVSAVRTASGEQPRVIGKPHAAMFEAALGDLDSAEAVMIGDSLATDILGARRLRITAMLLAGGDPPWQQENGLESPDLVISSLGDLLDR